MKTIILIFSFYFVLLSCKTHNVSSSKKKKNDLKFEILNIELIETNYVIYAKRNDSVFKIASTQKDTIPCMQIKKGGFYNLKIKSVFSPNYHQKLDIAGVKYNGIMIKLERGNGIIWDLFVSENLRGLCYLK